MQYHPQGYTERKVAFRIRGVILVEKHGNMTLNCKPYRKTFVSKC